MKDDEIVNTTLNHYLQLGKEKRVCKGKLHGGHIAQIKPQVTDAILQFMQHARQKSGLPPTGTVHHEGEGGSIIMGGSLPSNPKEAYHWALNLTPHQLEMKREIAAQLLGAVPSPMWGGLLDAQDNLEADPEEYEKIIDMPNVHSLARMIEAEQGDSQGGGFWKAVKHVAKKAHGMYRWGSNLLKFANAVKEPVLNMPMFKDYKEGISAALETANALDKSINPIVEATIAATKDDATEEDRGKLRNMATDALSHAATTYYPGSKPYIDAAKELQSAYYERPKISNKPKHHKNPETEIVG